MATTRRLRGRDVLRIADLLQPTQNNSNNSAKNPKYNTIMLGPTKLLPSDVAEIGSKVTFPRSTSNLATLGLAETLTHKTLTAPVIGTIVNGLGTLTLPTSTDTLVGRATADTLTNKTLTAPVIDTIVNEGTLTLPTSTDTLVGKATTDTLTNKTLTAPVISTIVNGLGTLTLPTSTDTLVGRATTDTLTNKTLTAPVLTAPVIGTIVNGGTLTLPTSTDTLVGRATTDTLANKTLTSPVIATIVNGGTLTLPTSTDTLVGKDTTDTLTNKTLTAPVISTIVNSGQTLTLPTSADTLVGRATTDTLTNKTLTAPVISTIVNSGQTLTLPTSADTLVGRATTDTLTNKTLTAPIMSTIVNSGQTLTLPTSADTLVGRATTDTLTNKTLTAPVITAATIQTTVLTINNNQNQSVDTKQCRFETRTTGITFPVPTLEPPAGSNLPIAFDICPTTAVDSSSNGLAWIDVCDVPLIDASNAVCTLRLGMKQANIEIGCRVFGGSTVKPVLFKNDTNTVFGWNTSGVVTFGTALSTLSSSFTNRRIFVEGVLPGIVFNDTDAAANLKISEMFFQNGVWNLALWRDALGANFSIPLMVGWQAASPSLTSYAQVETLRASQTTNQLLLGTTNTINAVAQGGARTFTIPVQAADCDMQLGIKQRITTGASTPVSITAAQSGYIFNVVQQAGAITYNLPTAAAGLHYEFVLTTAAAGNFNITSPGGANTMVGILNTSAGAGAVSSSITLASALLARFVGSTAVRSDWIKVQCADGTNWHATGQSTATGGIAFATS